MQSTLAGRSAPHWPQQRTLHFSLLFGASGGVAQIERHRVPCTNRDRPDAVAPRRLVSDRDRSCLGGENCAIIDGGATLVYRAEGEE